MKKKLHVFLVAFFLLTLTMSAQQKLWTKISSDQATINTKKELAAAYDLYQLDVENLRSSLQNAVRRQGVFSSSKVKIHFPDASGKLIEYYIKEASVMHPDLAAKFPENKSYIGQSVHQKGTSVRFSLNSFGLHAMIFSVGKSTVYIDPVSEDKKTYMLYQRKDLKIAKAFECLVEEKVQVTQRNKATPRFKNANDLQLRTFELAMATTGEYSQFHIDAAGVSGGTDPEKVAAVMDAIVVTMTRVNGVYERDLALTMQLIPNNDQLIFLDGDTDPYENSDGILMLGQNQTTIDNIIGSANYDIGHVFSTGGGGIAALGSPCNNSIKARGVTGLPNPIGDPFDIDFVAHELGHQYGANHTFNGTTGNCTGANRNDATAVEPGSGTTIMAYAGICAPQNVQVNSDDYFHVISIQEMYDFISSGNSTCDDETALVSNANAPVANAGTNFTVPISTPLILRGQATDADGDRLTYTWEQIDNEVGAISIPPSSTQTEGAVFRSIAPDLFPERYLPALSTVISNNLSSTWEVLPSVGRNLNFRLTARDNAIGEGQTDSDDVLITVDENSGPFQVTSQNADDVFWAAGGSQTITWDVANTNTAPVNSPNVNILFSLDGGLTYPITLAGNTPNDGSQTITVPTNLTSTGRVKVEGANHIFYALNRSSINIVDDFALAIVENEVTVCKPDDAIFDFTVDFAAGFNGTVDFTATGVPAGAGESFNPTSANSNASIQLTINRTPNIAPGSYNIQVTGSSGGLSRTLDLVLNVFDPVITAPVLMNPSDGATAVPAIGTNFTWNSDVNISDYDLEIATDPLFNAIVESVNVTTNSYIPQNLQDGTTYYWRLRPNNPCGAGDFSQVRTFTTSEIVCRTYPSSDTPVSIPDNDPSGASSIINVPDDFIMSDVNVTINVDHTWMQDLVFELESPSGTIVELLNSQCPGPLNVNMAATFDDLGIDLVCANSSPVITGTIKPSEDLAGFNGESSSGNWTLRVTDNFADDAGSIESWSLELCESVTVASVGDDLFKDFNLWPNPANETVNISFVAPSIDATHIKIYDITGREVLHKIYSSTTVLFNEQVQINNLTSGTYLVKISSGNTNTTKRLLIF